MPSFKHDSRAAPSSACRVIRFGRRGLGSLTGRIGFLPPRPIRYPRAHYSGWHVKPTQKKQAGAARRAAARRGQLVKWIVGLSVVALVGYGLSQMSNIAYDDGDLAVVDFQDLSASEKRTALEAANSARCTCGCGMTLAQCVATDSTCPVREGNIGRIRTMVQQAKGT